MSRFEGADLRAPGDGSEQFSEEKTSFWDKVVGDACAGTLDEPTLTQACALFAEHSDRALFSRSLNQRRMLVSDYLSSHVFSISRFTAISF